MNNTVFWSWNNRIEKAEAERQVIAMAKQGIDGFFIHARPGLATEYMGEEWMDVIEHCVKVASEHGCKVWFYDEKNWPSGDAGGEVIKLGEDYVGKKLMAADHFDEAFAGRVIARYKRVNGIFEKTAEEKADLYVYYDLEKSSDRMFTDSGEAFVRLTHEKYKKRFGKYFGKEISGMFFDEPGNLFFWPDSDVLPWSKSIVDGFVKYYGYDPLPHLWKLFYEDEPSLFRSHYITVTGYLFHDNFITPIVRWCEKNGLLLVGHFCMEEAMYTSLRMAGSVMRVYGEMDVPGIDFLGRRNLSPVLTRQVSSATNQFGKDIIMCEVFGASGYDMTFTELISVWRQFGARGINMPCMHLFAYSTEGDRKYDFPGFFSTQSVWFEKMKVFTDELSFINKFASLGKEKNEVLIISPQKSLSGYRANSVSAREISSEFRQLLEETDAVQIGYDVGDEEVLSAFGSAADGKLTVGERSYKTVVVPKMSSVCLKTLKLLEEFERSGGSLIFVGGYPEFVDFEKNEELDAFIARFDRGEFGNVTFAKRNLLIKAFGNIKQERKIAVYDENGSLAAGVAVRLGEDEKKKYLTVVNSAGRDLSGYITVKDANSVYALSPRGREFVHSTLNKEGIYFPFRLRVGEGAYFVLDDGFEKPQKPHKTHVIRISPREVRALDDNAFVLDKVVVSIDGKCGKERFADNTEFPESEKLTVSYPFSCDGAPSRAIAVIEPKGVERVEINGTEISHGEIRKDTSTAEYSLNGKLLNGENVLTVYYADAGARCGERIDGIVIKGDLDALMENPNEYPLYYSADGCFIRGRRGESVPAVDLTAQGYCFYAGKAKWSFSFSGSAGEADLSFCGVKGCAVAEVYINGSYAFTAADLNAEYCVTLKDGENLIDVVAFSAEGNLKGPFHHPEGFPKLVSPNTFKGKWGITESILYPWIQNGEVFTEKYNFQKFGIAAIVIRTER